MIRSRIEPQLKSDVDAIFKTLGLSTSEAISLFYAQVRLNQGLPFEVRIPNQQTLAAIKEAKNSKNLPVFQSVKALMEDLESP